MPDPRRRSVSLAAATLTVAALTLVAYGRSRAGAGGSAAGPRLRLAAEAAGSPRRTLLEEVAKPLERRLLSLPGARRVESRSEDGRVVIEVEGEPGLDPDAFHLAALRRTEGLRLPLDRLALELLSSRAPLLEIAVRGGGSPARRGTFAREMLLPELARCRGAGRIEILGARALRIAVTPLGSALAARGLTALDLVGRLRTLGTPMSAGRMRDGAAVRPLALRERAASLQELGAVAIGGPDGGTPLSEVALLTPREIEDGSWFRWRGEEAVLIRLFAAPGGEAARCRREAGEALRRLREVARGSGFQLSPLPAERDAGTHLVLRYELLGDPAPADLRQRGAALERDLRAGLAGLHPDFVASLYRRGRTEEDAGGPEGASELSRGELRGRLEIAFPDPSGQRQARARLAARLRRIPDLAGWIEGTEAATVEISASTEAAAEALAERVRRTLAQQRGFWAADDPATLPLPSLLLAWDETLLLAARTDSAALGEQVRAALGGFALGQVEIAGVEPELWIEPTRVPAPDLLPLRPAGAAGVVPLRALGRIERGAAPAPLLRIDGRPAIRLFVAAPGANGGPDPATVLRAIPLGPGERLTVTLPTSGGA